MKWKSFVLNAHSFFVGALPYVIKNIPPNVVSGKEKPGQLSRAYTSLSNICGIASIFCQILPYMRKPLQFYFQI